MKHKKWLISIMLTLALLLSLVGTASADEPILDPHPMNADPPPVEMPDGSAIISNGTISLGVDSLGHLNFAGTGLRYLPTGGEVLWVGCFCEGWGAADATSGVQGWSSIHNGGINNVALVSFASTASTATSITTVGGILRVTHNFHPPRSRRSSTRST